MSPATFGGTPSANASAIIPTNFRTPAPKPSTGSTVLPPAPPGPPHGNPRNRGPSCSGGSLEPFFPLLGHLRSACPTHTRAVLPAGGPCPSCRGGSLDPFFFSSRAPALSPTHAVSG